MASSKPSSSSTSLPVFAPGPNTSSQSTSTVGAKLPSKKPVDHIRRQGLGGSGDLAYPGGPFFNTLGFGKDEKSMKDLKLKEIKNGRLAMLAILGYFIQGLVTGVGPFQNFLDHLADPINNNALTSLKFH